MTRFTNALDRVRIAAPCEAEWDEMERGEAKRRERLRIWRNS
jgi:hypothetical protein